MNPRDFQKGIEIITQTYGEIPTKGPRLQRIKNMCDGRISGQGFIDVCNAISDSFRHPPLPIDFEKGISDWRKRYYEQHGTKFGDESKEAYQAFTSQLNEKTLEEELKKTDSKSLWETILKTRGKK